MTLRQLLNFTYAALADRLGDEKIVDALLEPAEQDDAAVTAAIEQSVAARNQSWLADLRALGVPVPVPKG